MNKKIIATVDGCHQVGTFLQISPLLMNINNRPLIMIRGVYHYSFLQQKPHDLLRQFIVTSDAKKGDTMIQIYPPINHVEKKKHPNREYFTGYNGSNNGLVSDSPKDGADIFIYEWKI